ncbi:MAG TPA: hypothetical protein EYQ29_14025 [Candidatus Lambdaproteobacteria bacterium]|nr:hypothetical protein [Candidatus Lambdaproteobacteria bacterium]
MKKLSDKTNAHGQNKAAPLRYASLFLVVIRSIMRRLAPVISARTSGFWLSREENWQGDPQFLSPCALGLVKLSESVYSSNRFREQFS